MRDWLIMRRTRILLFAALCVLPLVVTTSVYAQGVEPAPTLQSWLAANAFALGVMTFHIGVAWREFLDHRKRLKDLETCTDVDIPATYMRKDVLSTRLDAMEERFDHELKTWRETFSILLRRPDRRGGAHDTP